MNTKKQATVVAAAVALGVVATQWMAACGGEGMALQPAPTAQGGSGGSEADASARPDASSEGGGGAAGAAGAPGSAGSAGAAGADGATPLRTVIVRNPFANLDTPDNLLLDGGFEFSGDMSSAWGLAARGQMEFRNGFVCRSGVRCAVVPTGEGIYGFFVSPRAGTMTLTVHVSPLRGACDSLQAFAFDAYDQGTGLQQIALSSQGVGPDGWCEVAGTVNALPHAVPAIYMLANTEPVVVDDIVMREGQVASSSRLLAAPMPTSTAMRSHLGRVAADARALLWHERKRTTPRQGAPWTARFHAWMR
ncbi:MAG: hypothetical protein MUF54_08385 [Polyangiaceae bacterium]|nr:hypothetical protein [Polyangiaceae bacterium]